MLTSGGVLRVGRGLKSEESKLQEEVAPVVPGVPVDNARPETNRFNEPITRNCWKIFRSIEQQDGDTAKVKIYVNDLCIGYRRI